MQHPVAPRGRSRPRASAPVHERHRRLLMVTVLLTAAAVLTAASTPRRGAGDPTPETTLRRFSAALCAGDVARLRALADPNFHLVEDGVDYDLEGTARSISATLQQGKLARTVGDVRVRAHGDVAWMVYSVTAEFQGAQGIMRFQRIESAVLERVGRGWRVSLITSMQTH